MQPPTRTYAVVALDQPRHQQTGTEDEDALDVPLLLESNPALGLVLHYHVPAHMEGEVQPGQLVAVPLRGRPTHGIVVDLSSRSPVEQTQPVARIVDSRPLVPPDMLALGHWIARHYRSTLWQALAPMLPPGVARRAITTVGLAADLADEDEEDPLIAALGRRQQQVVSLLKSAPRGKLTISRLRRSYTGAPSGLEPALRDLERKGLVSRQTELPPPRSRPQQERIIRLAASRETASEALRVAGQRAPLQAAALDWLMKRSDNLKGAIKPLPAEEGSDTEPGWLPLRDLYLHTGATSSTVAALERKELVELSERTIYRQPAPPSMHGGNDEPPPLTSAQAAAWREIAGALQSRGRDDRDQGPRVGGQNGAFLLHGVTGSGKTEIYLRAIGMALRLGKQAIVLVPEISLTPQAVHRFATRFPGRVALVHSQLSPGQQFDEWRRIREGHADIVVGSRSAVFAPMPRLGLIIVDEEHEWAYKQDHAPRYHARDVALKRAELAGAVVILGSATPDLVTYHKAQKGEYRLLAMPTRVGHRRAKDGSHLITEIPMPPVQVVDMRAELRSGNQSLFSRSLQVALDATLARKEQAILYLNRRGSNSFILCRQCGYVPLCPRCDVPLVYHTDIYGMLCHRCNAFSLAPHECPRCGSSQVKGFGTGTQRVVDEVAGLFPRTRILRWDRDTVSRQGGHQGLMEIFSKGEADVLVGTQMIAKGLDLARVTLVGVVGADTGLFLPDFRAPERSLQLLMQVAGRAGRRADTTHSRVVVQTFNPDHYVIQAAAQYDYKGFYRGEIRFRAEHGYPPYGQLARLVYTSPSDERCERESDLVARHLRRKAEQIFYTSRFEANNVDVLGPAPCFVHKVRGQYRWQVLVRADDVGPVLDGFYPGSGWTIDVDPVSVL